MIERKIIELLRNFVNITSTNKYPENKKIDKKSKEILNIELLEKNYKMISRETIISIMETFFENSDKNIEKLYKSYENEDYKNIAFYAHSIKSSSSSLYLEKLSEICDNLEKASLKRNKLSVDENFFYLEEIYPESKKQLKKYIEGK